MNSQECGDIEQLSAALLGVLEVEEEVEMADENADQLMQSSSGDNEVYGEEDPGEIAGLESRSKPERHNLLLV